MQSNCNECECGKRSKTSVYTERNSGIHRVEAEKVTARIRSGKDPDIIGMNMGML